MNSTLTPFIDRTLALEDIDTTYGDGGADSTIMLPTPRLDTTVENNFMSLMRLSDLQEDPKDTTAWWAWWKERKTEYWWRFALVHWWQTKSEREKKQWWREWRHRRRRRNEKLCRVGKAVAQIMSPDLCSMTLSRRSVAPLMFHDKENTLNSSTMDGPTQLFGGSDVKWQSVADRATTSLRAIDRLQVTLEADEARHEEETAALTRVDQALDAALWEHMTETQRMVEQMEVDFREAAQEVEHAESLRLDAEEKEMHHLEETQRLHEELEEAIVARQVLENERESEKSQIRRAVEDELEEKYQIEETEKHKREVCEILGLTYIASDDTTEPTITLPPPSEILRSTMMLKTAHQDAEGQLECLRQNVELVTQERDDAQNRLAAIEAKTEELQAELTAAHEQQQREQRSRESLQREADSAQSRMEAMEHTAMEREVRLNEQQQRIKQDLEARIGSLMEDMAVLTEERDAALESKIEESAEDKYNMTNLLSDYGIVMADRDELQKRVGEQEDHIKAIMNESDARATRISELEGEIDGTTTHEAELSCLQDEAAALKETLSQLQLDNEQLKKESEEKSVRMAELEAEIARIDGNMHVQEETIATLESHLESARDNIAHLETVNQSQGQEIADQHVMYHRLNNEMMSEIERIQTDLGEAADREQALTRECEDKAAVIAGLNAESVLNQREAADQINAMKKSAELLESEIHRLMDDNTSKDQQCIDELRQLIETRQADYLKEKGEQHKTVTSLQTQLSQAAHRTCEMEQVIRDLKNDLAKSEHDRIAAMQDMEGQVDQYSQEAADREAQYETLERDNEAQMSAIESQLSEQKAKADKELSDMATQLNGMMAELEQAKSALLDRDSEAKAEIGRLMHQQSDMTSQITAMQSDMQKQRNEASVELLQQRESITAHMRRETAARDTKITYLQSELAMRTSPGVEQGIQTDPTDVIHVIEDYSPDSSFQEDAEEFEASPTKTELMHLPDDGIFTFDSKDFGAMLRRSHSVASIASSDVGAPLRRSQSVVDLPSTPKAPRSRRLSIQDVFRRKKKNKPMTTDGPMSTKMGAALRMMVGAVALGTGINVPSQEFGKQSRSMGPRSSSVARRPPMVPKKTTPPPLSRSNSGFGLGDGAPWRFDNEERFKDSPSRGWREDDALAIAHNEFEEERKSKFGEREATSSTSSSPLFVPPMK